MRQLCIAALVCTLVAAPAPAQTPQADKDLAAIADIQARMNAAPNAALPPVASLTCEQMQAELMVAGRAMSGQLDPNFAANALALQDQMRSTTPVAPTAAEVAKNHARVNQLGGQVAGSMQGIDVQRMMALTDAFSTKNCKTPQ